MKAEHVAAANQPTRTDILALIDDSLARVTGLTAEGTGDGFDVPSWVPVAGSAGLLGIGLGAYKYLQSGAAQDEEDDG